MPKDAEWVVHTKDSTTLLLLKSSDGQLRSPTADEAHKAASYLNEQDSYIVTLYCRNDACKDKGAWIRRSVEDAKKNQYTCEVCLQLMVR